MTPNVPAARSCMPVSISPGRDEDTYRTRGRLTRLIEQGRWSGYAQLGAGKVGIEEGGNWKKIASRYLV